MEKTMGSPENSQEKLQELIKTAQDALDQWSLTKTSVVICDELYSNKEKEIKCIDNALDALTKIAQLPTSSLEPNIQKVFNLSYQLTAKKCDPEKAGRIVELHNFFSTFSRSASQPSVPVGRDGQKKEPAKSTLTTAKILEFFL